MWQILFFSSSSFFLFFACLFVCCMHTFGVLLMTIYVDLFTLRAAHAVGGVVVGVCVGFTKVLRNILFDLCIFV